MTKTFLAGTNAETTVAPGVVLPHEAVHENAQRTQLSCHEV
jgi:hypothetical protein